jgi:predicted transposase/invertase (TIGR01784 family)
MDDCADSYYRREVKLMDTRTKDVFFDKLTFVYLEMPKFNKTESELETMFDKWLFVLRNLSRLMERPVALQERVFTRLFEAAEIARFSRPDLVAYEDSLKAYRDWYSVMKTAEDKGHAKGLVEGLEKGLAEGREKGLVEGRAEGRAEGREEERLSIARMMKSQGISPEDIALFTKLSVDEINAL